MATMFVGSHTVSAAENTMPDPARFPFAAPYTAQDVFLLSARSNGTSYNLDAPVSTVRIYTPNRSGVIKIYDGAANCTNTSTDRGNTKTLFYVLNVSADETTTTGLASVGTGYLGGYPSGNFSCGTWIDILYDVGTSPKSTVLGHTNYYVLEFMSVAYEGSGWNMFKIQMNTVPASIIGYSSRNPDSSRNTDPNSARKFALKAAGTGTGDGGSTKGNFELPFAPDCTFGGGEVQFDWFDADAGQVNQNYEGTIRTVLYDETTGWSRVIDVTQLNNGGNGVGGSFSQYITPGHKYRWVWEGIWQNNGIQFKLPFDSVNYYTTCNKLTAKHVDENNTEMVSSSSNFINKIVCSTDFFGSCTASRGGSSYGIYLKDENYTVTNTGTVPSGYTYTGYTYTGFFDVREGTGNTVVFSANYLNNAPKITWKYRKIPGQNCLPPSQTVGINEPALLTSTVTPNVFTTNVWSAGFGNPTTGNGTNFTVSYAAVGNFPVTLTVNGTTSTCYVVVTQKPYIRAYGGDIFAGSMAGCTGWNNSGYLGANFNSGIYGFTGPPVGAGSGAQLGVLAMGQIWDFNSAMLRTGATAPQPANGLTFGNTFLYGSTVIPGMLSVSHCPPNYWGQIETTGPVAIASSNIVLSTVKKTEVLYYSTGDDTAVFNIGPTSLVDGLVSSVYVKGSLVIKGDIKYTGANSSWASAGDIPRLQIVVTGNIYIDRTVEQLDGIYVAQGKTIYTCTNGAALFASVNLYNDCNTQLTVNGALLATRIKWLRTFGDLSNSSPLLINGAGEYPSSLSAQNRNCISNGVTFTKPVCASEIVNLGPEAWMEQSSSVNPTANYIQALPPLL